LGVRAVGLGLREAIVLRSSCSWEYEQSSVFVYGSSGWVVNGGGNINGSAPPASPARSASRVAVHSLHVR
jgi:hypothetical protein